MSECPRSLARLAELAENLERFQALVGAWLEGVAEFTTGREAGEAVGPEPALLGDRFAQGDVADAWLAALAELLAAKAALVPPSWAFGERRMAATAWFAPGATATSARLRVLRDTPGAFKRRNLYPGPVDLRFEVRPGRPKRSPEEKRLTNRERQRRFQARRKEELLRLRQQAGHAPL